MANRWRENRTNLNGSSREEAGGQVHRWIDRPVLRTAGFPLTDPGRESAVGLPCQPDDESWRACCALFELRTWVIGDDAYMVLLITILAPNILDGAHDV